MKARESSQRDQLDSGGGRAIFGLLAEYVMAATIMRGSPGKVAVARPIVDLGFDGYIRRVGTLSIVPYQLKSRRYIRWDGVYFDRFRVGSLRPDPRAVILFTYVPPPGLSLHQRFFAIPVTEFIAHCPREKYLDQELFRFAASMSGDGRSKWEPYLVETERLQQQWLDEIRAWHDPLPPHPIPRPVQIHRSGEKPGGAKPTDGRADPHNHVLHGRYAELFVGGRVQFAGRDQVIVAQDRSRFDTVTLLLHDLRSFRLAGLSVHTGFVDHRGYVPLNVRQQSIFIDPNMWLLLIVSQPDGSFHNTSFLIPSAAIPSVMPGTHDRRGQIAFVDRIPIADIRPRYRPY